MRFNREPDEQQHKFHDEGHGSTGKPEVRALNNTGSAFGDRFRVNCRRDRGLLIAVLDLKMDGFAIFAAESRDYQAEWD